MLENTFLFKGIGAEKLSALTEDVAFILKKYKRNEAILCEAEGERALGFILSGECEVRCKFGTEASLNRISEGGSFGIYSLFSEKEEPTALHAARECEILFIKKKDVLSLMRKEESIAANVIRFLTDRIGFLNEKIATLTSGGVEEKLAAYLLSQFEKNGSLQFPFNRKRTAESLGCGRASLYRGLDALGSLGLVRLEDKNLIITDKIGLERIIK